MQKIQNPVQVLYVMLKFYTRCKKIQDSVQDLCNMLKQYPIWTVLTQFLKFLVQCQVNFPTCLNKIFLLPLSTSLLSLPRLKFFMLIRQIFYEFLGLVSYPTKKEKFFSFGNYIDMFQQDSSPLIIVSQYNSSYSPIPQYYSLCYNLRSFLIVLISFDYCCYCYSTISYLRAGFSSVFSCSV